MEPPRPPSPGPAPSSPTLSEAERREIEARVVEVLRGVYDPEIPVDIYELGLVYGIDVHPDGWVVVRMTLTSPTCPVAESLPADVEGRVRSVPGVTGAEVDLTWDPPWDPSRMSEAARLELGLM